MHSITYFFVMMLISFVFVLAYSALVEGWKKDKFIDRALALWALAWCSIGAAVATYVFLDPKI